MKFTALEIVLLSLATYRLALLASKETGPFWMFKKFRQWVKRETPKKSHLDEGVDCIWCWSVWVAFPVCVSAWFLWDSQIFQIVILSLSVSAAAVICNQLFTKGR